MKNEIIKEDNFKLSEEEILKYMNEAFIECSNALERGEVPVGCVFLHLPSKKIIARGHNLTNKTKNATTHSEINCIYSINEIMTNEIEKKELLNKCGIIQSEENNFINLFSDCVLFVSCEPCIMCAYALSLVMYFGCENDKFGGNGSILSLHCGPNYSYQSEGGYLKDTAIDYFRKFYIRGNEKAPDHKRQRKLI